MSEFEFLSGKIFSFWVYHKLTFWVYHIWLLEFCCYLSWVLLLFEFCHKMSSKFCYNLIFFSFVTIWGFEFCSNWVFELSQFEFLSTVTIWVKLGYNLSFWWKQFVAEKSLLLKKSWCNFFLVKIKLCFCWKNKFFLLNKLLVTKQGFNKIVFGENIFCERRF